jgi:hypothetical protein
MPDDPQLGQAANDAADDSPESLDAVIEHDTDEAVTPALPEDHDTPFSPPDSPRTDPGQEINREIAETTIPDTHQTTDTNIQPEEVYDEGESGGAEAVEPNAGNAVVDFHPADSEDKAA